MSSWFPFLWQKNSQTLIPSLHSNQGQIREDEHIFGVSEDLILFVKSFSVDDFRIKSYFGENDVRNDLSPWQEQHATHILSKVKEMRELRYKLCPRMLKENQFWNIYFLLTHPYISQYELRVEKGVKNEVEMGERSKKQGMF